MATHIWPIPQMQLKPPSGSNDGWELIEDVPFIGGETLEFVPVLQEGDGDVIKGKILWVKEREVAAGLKHLECLRGMVTKIPRELDDKYLLALGTVGRGPSGCWVVPCLSPRRGKKRTLFFCYYLGHNFNRNSVSVRLRK
ncbi:MAG: hypothetical protein AAB483_02680 [Patescibacteria group bacterium]